MSRLQYIRACYNVPAFRGRRVRYTWEDPPKEGRIVMARGARLGVMFDGDKRMTTLHPTWELQYLSGAKGERVLLNGIEVDDCMAFNLDEGFIERLARDEWGGYLWTGPRFNPCHAIERVYGLVEIERTE